MQTNLAKIEKVGNNIYYAQEAAPSRWIKGLK